MYFGGEGCGEVSWVLVGALVREVDERLQAFTRDCERWVDCLNQDLRDFMDFRDGSCPPVEVRPYECLREFTREWRESTSVHERLPNLVKGPRRVWDGQPANSA